MARRSKKRSIAKAPAQADASTWDGPVEIVEVSSLPVAMAPYVRAYDDGEKFFGGFGSTLILEVDYWTLRARSAQLFETNLYARGIIRRLVTNEINTGLHLECKPEEKILGYEEDGLADLAEDIENRFALWERSPEQCDASQMARFGEIQAIARMEALVCGDVLVTIRQNRGTGMPAVKLISGSAVQTPANASVRTGHRIEHGVELDTMDRQVAYWIVQRDGIARRLPAYGERSGRRTAWLVYGTDRRLDSVRGKPILSLVLQSLREIDRYRDSTQRKAVLNSMLAMFVSKAEERAGSRPLTGGATRRGAVSQATGDGAGPRRFSVAEHIPGLVIDELQFGEEPKAFTSNGTDERFGDFEEAIIQSVAWANEIPPEILRLSFSSNYSASQAAINEFKMYLNKVRTDFGASFCQPIYAEWLLSSVIAGKVNAPGLLDDWRRPNSYDRYGAWISAEWSGHIKPAVDMSKLVKGYKILVEEGFITRDRASRELTGTKFSKNVQQLARENEALKRATPAEEGLTGAPNAPVGRAPGSSTTRSRALRSVPSDGA